MNKQLDFDVVIVGYGPVGQGLAAMLGQAGYRVGVFERWPSLYPLPRACVIDHEIMRVLQTVGVAEEFAELAVPTDGEYVWLNAAGETLYHFKYSRDGISGWPARSLMYQPELEAVLDRRVRTLPSVEVNQGWEAVSYTDRGDFAELGVAQGGIDAETGRFARTDKIRQVTARYVIGADGANSFVRQAAGMSWTDLGFRADWLVVDYRPHRPEVLLDMPQAGQICDPARPITLMRHMGKRHTRWEMMLLPGESASDMTRPEVVWPMIAKWATPDDGVIDRAAVYTFRSGVADTWVKGPAILVGDAAHLMPPFLGQGLCSGMRDALAVFWRLDLLLKGNASDDVLATYVAERKRHVSTVIDRAVALGKVVCITDPKIAAERDAAILANTAPPIPPFPGLTTGLLHVDPSADAPASPVGLLALQARARVDGRVGRLDDLVGAGWQLLTVSHAVDTTLSVHQKAFAARIGLRMVDLQDANAGAGIVDVDGAYRRYFDELGVQALIVRPDFYIYAAAKDVQDVPGLLDELAGLITAA